jgi:hypothetical protein
LWLYTEFWTMSPNTAAVTEALSIRKRFEMSKNSFWTFQPLEMRTLHCLRTSEFKYPLTQHHIPEDWNPVICISSKLNGSTLSCYVTVLLMFYIHQNASVGFKFGKLFVIGSSISMGWFCYLSHVGCRTLQMFVVLCTQLFLFGCFASVTVRQV